jgi:hypothetical protein
MHVKSPISRGVSKESIAMQGTVKSPTINECKETKSGSSRRSKETYVKRHTGVCKESIAKQGTWRRCQISRRSMCVASEAPSYVYVKDQNEDVLRCIKVY